MSNIELMSNIDLMSNIELMSNIDLTSNIDLMSKILMYIEVNMLDYTISSVSNLFSFIKKLIYAFQIAFQVIYIMFLTYMLVQGLGTMAYNITLLVLSVLFILQQLLTTREFYTKRQILRKDATKWCIKIAKYVANVCIIAVASVLLISGKAQNENATMLTTVIMIFGLLTSIILDMVLLLIDRNIKLINYAIAYDANRFTANHEFATWAVNILKIDIKNAFPKPDDKKADKKIKDINHKYKLKKMKKRDFQKRIK